MLRPVLAGLVLVAAIALSGCMPERESAPSPTPVPSSTEEQTPTPTPDAAGELVVPATCEELVPQAQRDAMDHLDLNTAASQNAGLPANLSNAGLSELVEDERVLACVWTGPDPRSTYLSTSVVRIDGGQGAQAVAGLRGDRVECYPADEGTRCEYSSVRDEPAVEYGETHFFRDDLWVSTAWSNVAPPGYTTAVVDALWP